MKIKRLLRALPIMLIVTLVGVGLFASPVSALASWTITPGSGTPGSTVSVTAAGLTPGDTFSVKWDILVAGIPAPVTATVDSHGAASLTLTVPTVLPGSTYAGILVATSTPQGGGAPVTIAPSYDFTILPSVVLSQNTGVTGTAMTATGFGFEPSTNINVFFDNSTATITTAVTNLNGAFSVQFTLPQLTRGPHILFAQESTGSLTYAQTNLSVVSTLTSTTLTGFVGDSITVTGNGFIGGDSSTQNVVFTLDSAVISGITTASNTNGNFTRIITIPPMTRGSHTISASDGFGSASFTFAVGSKITVTPISGTVGTPVTVTGTGFAASVSVALTLDGAAIPGVAAATSDAVGGFSKAAIIIPITGAGTHTITATDSTGSASATFTVKSSISLSQSSGYAGDTVTVSGNGFYPAASITLAYDSSVLTPVPASVIIQSNGSFTAQFTVPGTAAGAHNVIVSDGLGDVATAPFTNTIDSAIAPVTSSTSQGFVGQDVTLTGKGFKPGATVTATFDTKQVGTATASASGSFSIPFKAPVVTGGNHTITVTDSITTKTFTYFMDNTAPAGPALTTPMTATKSKQPIDFTWAAVTDPSNPVTYKLEVATDANFTTLILSKEGLTTPSYTTTDAEKLPTVSKKAPYYWRVIATDGAGNVGTPSTASTFVVGFAWADVPIWVWILAVVFVVIIAGGITYLITRRRSSF